MLSCAKGAITRSCANTKVAKPVVVTVTVWLKVVVEPELHPCTVSSNLAGCNHQRNSLG